MRVWGVLALFIALTVIALSIIGATDQKNPSLFVLGFCGSGIILALLEVASAISKLKEK